MDPLTREAAILSAGTLHPSHYMHKISFWRALELFFYVSNRLLISLEQFALVSGFFFLVFLVLYPMFHRFEVSAGLLLKLSEYYSDGMWKVLLSRSEWAIELSKYVLLWVTLIGGALAVAHQKHITIDIMTKFLSLKTRILFSIFSSIVGILFCLWLTGASISYVYQDMQAEIKTTTMQIPLWWIKLIFPWGFLVCSFHYSVALLEDLRGYFLKDYTYLSRREAPLEVSKEAENKASPLINGSSPTTLSKEGASGVLPSVQASSKEGGKV
jgi:TRAP-type C4-dicarboxylate transport system permease small subunit